MLQPRAIWRKCFLGLSVVLCTAIGIGTLGETDAQATTNSQGKDDIPTEGSELLFWLKQGQYRSWYSEFIPHESKGPHFGRVRALFNLPLYLSRSLDESAHPTGSAAVLELYTPGGDTLLGWAVYVKVREPGTAADNWYWYQYYDGTVYADGDGLVLCTRCHRPDRNIALTAWPLR